MDNQVDARMLNEMLDIFISWSQRPQADGTFMCYHGVTLPSPIKKTDGCLGFSVRDKDTVLIKVSDGSTRLTDAEWQTVRECVSSRFSVLEEWKSTRGRSFRLKHSVHSSILSSRGGATSTPIVKPDYRESEYVTQKVNERQAELAKLKEFGIKVEGQVGEILGRFNVTDVEKPSLYVSSYDYTGVFFRRFKLGDETFTIKATVKDGDVLFSIRLAESKLENFSLKNLEEAVEFFSRTSY